VLAIQMRQPAPCLTSLARRMSPHPGAWHRGQPPPPPGNPPPPVPKPYPDGVPAWPPLGRDPFHRW
jgi:hypothetical protein